MVGVILSAWGIIQLSLTALAFYQKSVAMVVDLPEAAFEACEHGKCDMEKTVNLMEEAYHQQAFNCMIAAWMYVLTLIVSLHQFWTNNKKDK